MYNYTCIYAHVPVPDRVASFVLVTCLCCVAKGVNHVYCGNLLMHVASTQEVRAPPLTKIQRHGTLNTMFANKYATVSSLNIICIQDYHICMYMYACHIYIYMPILTMNPATCIMKSTKVQNPRRRYYMHYVLFGVLIQHSHEGIAAHFTYTEVSQHSSHEGTAPQFIPRYYA